MDASLVTFHATIDWKAVPNTHCYLHADETLCRVGDLQKLLSRPKFCNVCWATMLGISKLTTAEDSPNCYNTHHNHSKGKNYYQPQSMTIAEMLNSTAILMRLFMLSMLPLDSHLLAKKASRFASENFFHFTNYIYYSLSLPHAHHDHHSYSTLISQPLNTPYTYLHDFTQ